MPGRSITCLQAKVYMSERRDHESQIISAARAGMSLRTASRIEGNPGAYTNPPPDIRRYRTRADPFSAVWATEVVPRLEAEPTLLAVTLLNDLQHRHPGQYPDSLRRTLQRRVRDWLGIHGPGRTVMFPQVHPPGEMGITDFTEADELQVTILGSTLLHRLFHFRLACSGWEAVSVVLGGESYPALAEGLSRALSELGGAPRTHRTDSLSAAYKNLGNEEDFTEAYGALCAHYGMQPTRNNRGVSHENGSIEGPNGHLKRRLDQALLLRGSREFPTIESYRLWIDEQVGYINARSEKRIDAERPFLRQLPPHPAVTWQAVPVRVTTFSTIVIRKMVYSVPSRLKGLRLMVHMFDDHLECFLGSSLVMSMARQRPNPLHPRRFSYVINYHHIIDSLVRKPAAFRNLIYRDQVHPSGIFRRAWDAIHAAVEPRQACREYVGLLHLAHRYSCEHAVSARLESMMDEGLVPRLDVLRLEFEAPPTSDIPDITISLPSLEGYDELFVSTSWATPQEITA